jgi:hypothetical protein
MSVGAYHNLHQSFGFVEKEEVLSPFTPIATPIKRDEEEAVTIQYRDESGSSCLGPPKVRLVLTSLMSTGCIKLELLCLPKQSRVKDILKSLINKHYSASLQPVSDSGKVDTGNNQWEVYCKNRQEFMNPNRTIAFYRLKRAVRQCSLLVSLCNFRQLIMFLFR